MCTCEMAGIHVTNFLNFFFSIIADRAPALVPGIQHDFKHRSRQKILNCLVLGHIYSSFFFLLAMRVSKELIPFLFIH